MPLSRPSGSVRGGRGGCFVFSAAGAARGRVGTAQAFESGGRCAAGDWAGHAQYDDGGSRFSLCLISAEFDNGMTLAFIRKAEGFAFFISDPRWQLEQYATYSLTVSIDRLWSERVEGRSEVRRVGKECGSTCSSRGYPCH